MQMVEAIAGDIVAALSPAELLNTFPLQGRGDPRDELVDWLLSENRTTPADLTLFVDEYLGRLGVDAVLAQLGITIDRAAPLAARIENWFAFREFEMTKPSVRPHALASEICELANQIKATPDKFDSIDVLINWCTLLLRYVCLYYAADLAADPACEGLLASSSDAADCIARISFEDLCRLASSTSPLASEPYKPSSEQVTLSDAATQAILSRLAGAQAAHPPAARAKTASDAALDVLEKWQAHSPVSVIPKGAVLVEWQTSAYSQQGICYDESSHRVSLLNMRTPLRRGDNVLLAAAAGDEVTAPRIKAVPAAPLWITPHQATAGARITPQALNRRKHNFVFISYAHEDAAWEKKLRKYLGQLHDQKIIRLWTDTQIESGEQWKEKIQTALDAAGVAILLVSTDFLVSDFIMKTEWPAILKAREKDGLQIFILIVRKVYLNIYSDLEALQAVNPLDRPLDGLSEQEQETVFLKLVREVHEHCSKNSASSKVRG